MSIIHWVYLAEASKRYTLYLTPNEIIAHIKQWYPDTTLSGNIIKIRRSFWYTRNLHVISGPMPTILESSWAMSRGMWIIFIISLILAILPGMVLGTIHWISNVDFARDLIYKIDYNSLNKPPYAHWNYKRNK